MDPWGEKKEKQTNSLSLVEKTRIEREERAKKKKLESSIVTLQSKYRGKRSRKTLQVTLLEELTRKLQDIEKIEKVMEISKKPAYSLPPKATIRLTRVLFMLLFLSKKKKQQYLELNTKVSRVVIPVIKNKTLQTIWDDPSTKFRFQQMIILELEYASTNFQLIDAFLQEDWSSEWIIQNILLKQEQIVRTRLSSLKHNLITCDIFISLLLQSQKKIQKVENSCYFHLLIFSIPGLFSRISSREIFLEFVDDGPQFQRILTKLSTCEEEDLAISYLGNLFSLILKFPEKCLEKGNVMLFDTIFRLFQRVPINTYMGNEGVGWNSGKVSKVDAASLSQLDFSTICPIIGEKALQVNELRNTLRLESDQSEWEKISTQVIQKETKSRIHLILSTTSSWAKRIGLTGASATAVNEAPNNPTSSLLRNQSAESRKLASTQSLFVQPILVSLFFKILALYFFRWPPKAANPKTLPVLNSVSFSLTQSVDKCWAFAESRFESRSSIPQINDDFWSASFTFSIIACHFLLVTDEVEFYEKNIPFSRSSLERCVTKLNQVLYALNYKSMNSDGFEFVYVKRVVRFLTQIRDMHSRRSLTREMAWLAPSVTSSTSIFNRFKSAVGVGRETLTEQEQIYIDNELFWCLPFDRRAKLFSQMIATERTIHQPPDEPAKYQLRVRRRNGGLDEALPFFLKSDLHKRIYVVFQNDFGLDEAGIDARGLFKEFIQTLAGMNTHEDLLHPFELTTKKEIVFDPKRGLFAMTEEGDKCLFPNPKAKLLLGSGEAIRMFQFAGKLVGKALFEGIVIQPQFSFFILAKLLRKLVTISDLASLDQELFKNLLFLKNTTHNINDLCLTFSTTNAATGKEIELYPGGGHADITNQNKFKYINLMAHYKLNIESKEEHEAFIGGFQSVIKHEWIQPFSERELQVLISGIPGNLDIADLKANCTYGGGYFSSSQVVIWFWDIVERDMNENERALLLRFATACTRAPLLGFGHLEPKFQIQRVTLDGMQLPTASTCFNILKLPAYPSKQVLRDKLLQAIKSGAGFELT